MNESTMARMIPLSMATRESDKLILDMEENSVKFMDQLHLEYEKLAQS